MRTTGSRRRCRGDGGVVLVEAAFVAPVMLTILAGLLEYGLVYRDLLTITDAAMEGAKVGSIQGPNPTTTGTNADYSIVATVRQDLAVIPYTWIDRIVVFRGFPPAAGDALRQVPPSCKTGAYGADSGNKCNVYDPYSAFLAVQSGNASYFVCSGGNTSCGWNPTARVNGPKWNNIEYLGVYVKLKRPMLTGLFGTEKTIEAAAIFRLEPGALN